MLKKVKIIAREWSFIGIPLLYIAIRIILHNGYKETYGSFFFDGALIGLLFITFTTRSFIMHILKSLIVISIVIFSTEQFWSYMNHPWFAGPETNTCDGRCFGWFSFENPSPTFLIAFFGVIFSFTTAILKTFILYTVRKLRIEIT